MAETRTSKISESRLMTGGSKRNRVPTQATALDVDGAMLRVASGTRRGDRVEFNRLGATPLPLPEDADRGDPAVMGQAIRSALDTLGFKPGTVAVGVPRRESILRSVVLPDVEDPRELASIVQLQVGRDLPYRKEDAVIDFEVRHPAVAAPAPEQPGEAAAGLAQAEALVAVAQTGVVSFYQAACAAAGLKLGSLTFLPYANARVLASCGFGESQDTIALVMLRSAEVTVDVVRQGKLLFSRDAAIAGEHHEPEGGAPKSNGADGAEKPAEGDGATPPVALPLSMAERITIEVVRSLHAFGGMSLATAVGRVLVAGGTGQEAEICDALAKRLNVSATILDAAISFDVSAGDRDQVGGSIPAMGVVVAVTDPAGLPFDFLNPKRPAVQRDMRRIRLLATAAAVVVLLAGVGGVRRYLSNKRLRAQQALQTEISTLQKSQPLYRRTRAQAAGIQDWLKEDRNWLDHYAYLTAVLPGSEDIYITSLSIGAGGGIRLAVQARSGEVLARLDKQLRDAGYQVKPQAITPGVDRFGYNFRSSVELIVSPMMKIDLAKTKPPPARPADDISLTTAKPPQGAAVYGGGQ